MKRVMMVGSAEHTGGGVTSVIRLIKKMPVWDKYSIYWLGTQSQGNKLERLWLAVWGALRAPFLIWRYDIVHFHNVPGTGLYTQLPQLLVAKLFGKKVIVEWHVGNQLGNHTDNSLFQFWNKKSDLVLLLAKKWESFMCEKYPYVCGRTAVLYNACEVRPEVPRTQKKNSIILAAFLNDNKAPDLLLKAWAQLRFKYPEWTVTIMGNGEVERFRRMAHEMGLDEVRFPGYLTGDAREKAWREASIYCMASYQEGFPMVVLEAWNYGAAVVTTPVGGLPDVIEEGKNCLTFPFGDSDALTERLDVLMGSEMLREKMAKYGRACVGEKFSLEAINAKLDEIYQSLL